MHTNKQKEKEKFYLDKFLSLLSKVPDKIQCEEKPDFIITLQGKKVGIEVTEFYSDSKGENERPRQLVEKEWEERLRKKVMEEVEKWNELRQTHGLLFFAKLGLPSRKEHRKFAEELVKLSLEMIGSDCKTVNFRCKEIMAYYEYNYPLLKKYLNKFYLKRAGCYVTWGWNHDVSSIGLTEPEIIDTIKPKIEKADKYNQKEIDELWLLIVIVPDIKQ